MGFIILLAVLWFVCWLLNGIWSMLDDAIEWVRFQIVTRWPWWNRDLW